MIFPADPHPEPDIPRSENHWFWPNFIWFFTFLALPHGPMAPKRSLERFYASYASSKMFCEPCTTWNHFFRYTLDGFPGRPLIQNEFSQWLIHSEILWFWQNFIEISHFWCSLWVYLYFFQTEFAKKTPDLTVSDTKQKLLKIWAKSVTVFFCNLVTELSTLVLTRPLLKKCVLRT